MPRGQLLTLFASTLTSGASTVTGTGKTFNNAWREATIFLNVTAAAAGVGDTFDGFVDTSPDGGTTWYNIGHFTQVLGNGGAKQFVMSLRADNPGTSAVVAVTADAAAGATRQFGINDRLRGRYTTAGGTAVFTFSMLAYLK